MSNHLYFFFSDASYINHTLSENAPFIPQEVKNRLDELLYVSLNDSVYIFYEDGSFIINGQDFVFDLGISEGVVIYKPIIFRRVKKTFTHSGEITVAHICLGWQTTINGENHQRIIAVPEVGDLPIKILTKK